MANFFQRAIAAIGGAVGINSGGQIGVAGAQAALSNQQLSQAVATGTKLQSSGFTQVTHTTQGNVYTNPSTGQSTAPGSTDIPKAPTTKSSGSSSGGGSLLGSSSISSSNQLVGSSSKTLKLDIAPQGIQNPVRSSSNLPKLNIAPQGIQNPLESIRGQNVPKVQNRPTNFQGFIDTGVRGGKDLYQKGKNIVGNVVSSVNDFRAKGRNYFDTHTLFGSPINPNEVVGTGTQTFFTDADINPETGEIKYREIEYPITRGMARDYSVSQANELVNFASLGFSAAPRAIVSAIPLKTSNEFVAFRQTEDEFTNIRLIGKASREGTKPIYSIAGQTIKGKAELSFGYSFKAEKYIKLGKSQFKIKNPEPFVSISKGEDLGAAKFVREFQGLKASKEVSEVSIFEKGRIFTKTGFEDDVAAFAVKQYEREGLAFTKFKGGEPVLRIYKSGQKSLVIRDIDTEGVLFDLPSRSSSEFLPSFSMGDLVPALKNDRAVASLALAAKKSAERLLPKLIRPPIVSLPKVATGLNMVSASSEYGATGISVRDFGGNNVGSNFFNNFNFAGGVAAGSITKPTSAAELAPSQEFERYDIIPLVKPSERTRERFQPAFRSGQGTRQIAQPKQKDLLSPFQPSSEIAREIQKPRLGQRQKNIPLQLTKPRSRFSPRSPMKFPKMPLPKFPLALPKPNIVFKEKKKKISSEFSSQPKAYQPTLHAAAFNIKAPKIPRSYKIGAGGIAQRPLINFGRKKRR